MEIKDFDKKNKCKVRTAINSNGIGNITDIIIIINDTAKI
jgi:hypothetical protein